MSLCFLRLEATYSPWFLVPLSIFQVSNTAWLWQLSHPQISFSESSLWLRPPPPSTFKDRHNYIGSTWLIQNHLPIFKSADLQPEFPSAMEGNILQVAGIVTLTSLGDHYPTTTWEKGAEWASVRYFEEESIIAWWKELFPPVALKLETWKQTTTPPHDCPWIWTNHVMSLSLSIFICSRDNNNYLPEKSRR